MENTYEKVDEKGDFVNIDKLRETRIQMCHSQPFLGRLAASLNFSINNSITTAQTNGESVEVNEKFFAGLSPDERIGVVAHEVFHVVLKHMYRKLPWMRDKEWQIAADIIVNSYIKENNLTLPDDAITAKTWSGGAKEFEKFGKLTLEQLTALLMDREDENKNRDACKTEGGSGFGSGDGTDSQGKSSPLPSDPSNTATGRIDEPDHIKEVKKNGDPVKIANEIKTEMYRIDSKISMAMAATLIVGHKPCGVERFAKECLEKQSVSWAKKLEKKISSRSYTDYTWWPFNKRRIQYEEYHPVVKGKTIGTVLFTNDSSGSMGSDVLGKSKAMMRQLLTTYSGKFICLACDTEVYEVGTYTKASQVNNVKFPGGGGTSFRPPFRWANENLKEKITAHIYATDGVCNRFPKDAPNYPVYWLCYGLPDGEFKVPFGEVIYTD